MIISENSPKCTASCEIIINESDSTCSSSCDCSVYKTELARLKAQIAQTKLDILNGMLKKAHTKVPPSVLPDLVDNMGKYTPAELVKEFNPSESPTVDNAITALVKKTNNTNKVKLYNELPQACTTCKDWEKESKKWESAYLQQCDENEELREKYSLDMDECGGCGSEFNMHKLNARHECGCKLICNDCISEHDNKCPDFEK
jgi:hypothetical protein